MDRNSLIAIGLIIVIIFGYSWYTQPTKLELDRKQKIADSLHREDDALKKANIAAMAKNKDTVETEKRDTALLNKQLGGFSKSLNGSDSTITLKNSHLTIKISQKGGSLESVRLNEFKRSDSTQLFLLEKGKSNLGFQFLTKEVLFNSKDFYWQPSVVNDSLVVMKLEYAADKYIEQRYSLNKESYLVNYNLHFVGLNGIISENKSDIELTWNAQLPVQEKIKSIEQNSATVYYKNPGISPDNISPTSYSQNNFNSKTEWVAFKWQYFSAAFISKDGGFESGGYIKTHVNSDYKKLKNAETQLYLAFDQGADETHKMQFYFGPNRYKTLKNLNIELHRIIPLGWGIFGWVNRFVVIPVFNSLDFIGNYGIIILLLTLIIKLLLLPLVYRSYISTAKMRILKPELDAIKAKFNGDMQKIQSENMAMYRKAGVNPLSGCMPLLLQMPILIALFQFFPASFELRQKSFLWAQDLSRYDSVWDFGFNIPMYGDHLSLFTVLMTISTLIYTRMNNQLTGVSGQMKWISYLMPVMFLGFFNNYASGLTYYYFLANMVTFGQQAIFRKLVDENKLHAKINANKNKAGSKPKSKFQQRLEDYAKKRGADPKNFKR